MDHALWRRHLEQAERHVALGRRHIARQEEIIAELEGKGEETQTSRDLLAIFQSLQAGHEAHRQRLLSDLSPPLPTGPQLVTGAASAAASLGGAQTPAR